LLVLVPEEVEVCAATCVAGKINKPASKHLTRV
jgi:hypothetical protein